MSGSCACSKIRRSSRILTGVYDEALAPSGLSTVQFALLRTLQRLGPSSITHLAETTAHERSTLSRTLRPLEAQGFVLLDAGRDQRKRLVTLTDSGRSAIESALPYWHEAQKRVDDVLGPDRATLISLLDRVEELRS